MKNKKNIFFILIFIFIILIFFYFFKKNKNFSKKINNLLPSNITWNSKNNKIKKNKEYIKKLFLIKKYVKNNEIYKAEKIINFLLKNKNIDLNIYNLILFKKMQIFTNKNDFEKYSILLNNFNEKSWLGVKYNYLGDFFSKNNDKNKAIILWIKSSNYFYSKKISIFLKNKIKETL
ncbi:hypothetical protein RJX39_02250 [Buchnera aphidicola (Taiwanaphis decaspermi)]|uniref:hypothetical protein n=1 Tax=Buchnera aphidicola TaxID=9 RepID=UPI0031B811E3